MTQVTLNDEAVSRLNDVHDYVSLRDTKGKLLGYFVPADMAGSHTARSVKSPLTPEERARRLAEPGGITLAQFWEKMRQEHPEKFQ